MNKEQSNADLPHTLFTQMQEAVERAAKGNRDPETMRKACIDMDQLREQIRKREGILDIGVAAIRELREA